MAHIFDVIRLLGMTAITAASTALILWLLLVTGLAGQLATDTPNHRSLHTQAIPRVGGCAVAPVIVLGMLYWVNVLWPLACAVLFVALVSYLDDRRGLSARIRLVAHGLAVVAAILASLP